MNQKYYSWGLPVDISTHGHQIDQLINILHVFMIALFVGWCAFLIYTLVRFRQKPAKKAEYHEKHFKTPTYLEIGVALFEVALLFVLAIPLFYQVRRQFPPEDKSLIVRVVAEQFAWNIHYPGPDGVFGKTDIKKISPANPLGMDATDPAGKDDITNLNQLHVPVNTPVIVELSSKDVIHGFAIPVMRVKQDVIPGQQVRVWFEAKDTGNFEIACAQLCGLGHYRMRGFFIVETKEKFDAWIAAELAKRAPKPLLRTDT